MRTAFKLLPVVAGIFAAAFAAPSHAVGGPSGLKVGYAVQGTLGETIVNPYGLAPLTAVIRNGGYVLKHATVRIVPKEGGQEIKYDVGPQTLRTHGGIPVFGLYAGWRNTVEVTYTRVFQGEEKTVTESYVINTQPAWLETTGNPAIAQNFMTAKVTTPAPKEFSDRLYFINNLGAADVRASRAVWNNPVGGALQWNNPPRNAILDTKGEIRWYMKADRIYDPESLYDAGIMMGFHQNADGALSWGYGQHYAKYDLLGRKVFNRRLPANYADFSHAMMPAENGGYFLRVASPDLRRADDTRVRTVRDVIIEVDPNGQVVDEWRLWDILDPYRDTVLKVLDQGAVCLNIDASQAGKTLSAEELARMDQNDKFGDIVGSGAGRNWVHVNSVDYDPTDDSIIISSRHQSALIKIGRDKQVKWIMGSPEGWKGDFAKKVLKPVDKNGKPITCEGSTCEGDFDWSWTQHTGWRVDSKSDKNIFYLSVFDNGDARGMEQPALPEMKYSRAVIYKIDQKKMTIQQVWEYGKERGFEWYSPITSVTEYQADKNSVFVYSATASLNMKQFKSVSPNPVINEFKWGSTEPSVEIVLKSTMGYRALPISLDKAFSR